MAFKLGDVIIDRLQFGYGALADKALYALTQLQEATIDITADSTDVKDKDGNLVYRKYSGKTGEITATNAFLNLAIAEIFSATDAEVATAEKTIVMPIFKIVKAGETLDITDAVEEVMLQIYMSNVSVIRPDVFPMLNLLLDCIKALGDVLKELKDFKHSKKIEEYIIRVNDLEEQGDKLYLENMYQLHKEKDTLLIVSWRKIYDCLENCLDSCEHTADIVETVIMKNS